MLDVDFLMELFKQSVGRHILRIRKNLISTDTPILSVWRSSERGGVLKVVKANKVVIKCRLIGSRVRVETVDPN